MIVDSGIYNRDYACCNERSVTFHKTARERSDRHCAEGENVYNCGGDIVVSVINILLLRKKNKL